MARDDPMMRFRASEKLKREIEEAAARNGRSINSEIVHRLGMTNPNEAPLAVFLSEEAEELRHLLSGAQAECDRLSEEMERQKAAAIDNGPVDGMILGQLIVEHRWARERVADYERRLRRIKRVLGE
ncbi:Arc family DNA-binding protein [Acetobacter lovaniensis]|uniref:Arc-like DNA binding domain-containing protein n=1 Tax=Acetobacter lovaniensis TaxID=104100 RepID=A0A841QIM6_9PROT|nr:Arc family DNA-binding protein [Acetobacter lovaniensis]MBB6458003.1 hypothetical protein [Acetobacter lovaniensis]NHN82259.1 Arc family DNA-binding protein [Acetobacter lovaniensis]GBQ72907.1 hypothetical protein AA0474_2814 [Acetobacter lovaniensis NRIC 0474]